MSPLSDDSVLRHSETALHPTMVALSSNQIQLLIKQTNTIESGIIYIYES